MARQRSFFASLSPRQLTELAESIAQADRGEGEEVDSFFARMAQKHGFVRST